MSSSSQFNKNKSLYLGSPAAWLNWQEGQPNNWGGSEDCVLVDMKNSIETRDDNCDTRNDVICNVKGFQHFMLRGVCVKSPVDSFYVLGEAEKLTGYTQTLMLPSEKRSRWEIRRLVVFHYQSLSAGILGKCSTGHSVQADNTR